MIICFRVDSSTNIGSGHIMRCMTLADRLTKEGHEIFFISRELPGNLSDLIESRRYKLFRLPYDAIHQRSAPSVTGYAKLLGVEWQADADQTRTHCRKSAPIDWLVVDHYALDYQWEQAIRSEVKNLMVIDDLADRRHYCDILLDQNFYPDMSSRYRALVPQKCHVLIGPKYALLRSEFISARKSVGERTGKLSRILIFMGGIDLTNETEKAIDAFQSLNRSDITLDVVVGSSNPNKLHIKTICSTMKNVNYYCQVENIADLMVKADLCIGAGGSTTWERCCLGLPSMVITVADNQIRIAEAVHLYGAIQYLGNHDTVSSDDILRSLSAALRAPDKLRSMSYIAGKLVDGTGTELVMQYLNQT